MVSEYPSGCRPLTGLVHLVDGSTQYWAASPTMILHALTWVSLRPREVKILSGDESQQSSRILVKLSNVHLRTFSDAEITRSLISAFVEPIENVITSRDETFSVVLIEFTFYRTEDN
ncbi:MAG: hypothetical protein ABI947_28765 [Chloroflexota bacterium]